MCIICRNEKLGEEYLTHFKRASSSMKECEKILLQLSDFKNINGPNPIEAANNYRRHHKRLVKIRKFFNKTEELREI